MHDGSLWVAVRVEVDASQLINGHETQSQSPTILGECEGERVEERKGGREWKKGGKRKQQDEEC